MSTAEGLNFLQTESNNNYPRISKVQLVQQTAGAAMTRESDDDIRIIFSNCSHFISFDNRSVAQWSPTEIVFAPKAKREQLTFITTVADGPPETITIFQNDHNQKSIPFGGKRLSFHCGASGKCTYFWHCLRQAQRILFETVFFSLMSSNFIFFEKASNVSAALIK